MTWFRILKDIFDVDDTKEEDPSKPLPPKYRDILADNVEEEEQKVSRSDQVGKVRENKPNKDMCDAFPSCRKISELKCRACKTSYCRQHYEYFETSGHPGEPYNLGDNDNDEEPELED